MPKKVLDARSNIAQILLVVLLLPFLAILLRIIFGNDASSAIGFLGSLLGQIPLCGNLFEMFVQYGSGLTDPEAVRSVSSILLRSFPEALLLTVSVHSVNQIHKVIFQAHGLPIISTGAGVLLSAILSSLIKRSPNLIMEIGVDLVVVIGMIIALRAVFNRSGHGIFGLHRILIIIIDGILGVITCTYVCLLLMAALGYYPDFGDALRRVLIVSGLVIVAAIIRWFISLSEDDYD